MLKIKVHEKINTIWKPKTVTVGGMIWLAHNLDVDDGLDGIRETARNGCLYTYDAACRVVNDMLNGWHIATLEEWLRAASTFGGKHVGDSVIGLSKKFCDVMDIPLLHKFDDGTYFSDDFICGNERGQAVYALETKDKDLIELDRFGGDPDTIRFVRLIKD